MASNDPFIRGENVVLKFYQQKGLAMKPVYLAAKNWKVTENATEVAEGVNGENRDRLDKVTNFYDVSFDVFQPDMEFLDAYMEAQDAMDNNEFPLKQTFGVIIKTPRGNHAYICQEAMVGPWDTGMSGRADPYMATCKARFRYYKKAPSL